MEKRNEKEERESAGDRYMEESKGRIVERNQGLREPNGISRSVRFVTWSQLVIWSLAPGIFEEGFRVAARMHESLFIILIIIIIILFYFMLSLIQDYSLFQG